MLWMTSSSTGVPSARGSQFGDGSCCAPAAQPSTPTWKAGMPAASVRCMDIQPLHAITQLAEADSQQFCRLSPVEMRLRQRTANDFALDVVQVVGQRF